MRSMKRAYLDNSSERMREQMSTEMTRTYLFTVLSALSPDFVKRETSLSWKTDTKTREDEKNQIVLFEGFGFYEQPQNKVSRLG